MIIGRIAAVAVAVIVALSMPASALAQFSSPKLLSGTSRLQFERASAPALASEGAYVTFQGALAGVSGVWRRDLQSGVVEPVATAYDSADPAISAPSEPLSAGDAAAPSISANGRYIAFTTTADLEPEHLNFAGEPEGEPAADVHCPEVYVRDMSVAAGDPGAYTLASAIGKSGVGITFAGGCSAGSGGAFPVAGAQAAQGVALSANGRSVAFTVLSRSNLEPGPGCAPDDMAAECPPETPSSQVAVRNLEAGITTLVSATPQGQPVPGGGAYPSELSAAFSLRVQSTLMGEEGTASTAAISGQGTTVAWLGTDVPAQVPGSGPEIEGRTKQHTGGEDPAPYEVEPLWRTIGEAEDGPTKRLLAGAGLEFFYSLSTPYEEATSAGSFVATREEPLFLPPVLSESGETVALVADAPRPVALESLVLSNEYPPQTDAYAVHVTPAPGASPEVTPITRTLDYDIKKSTASYGFVKDVAISPDGSHIAFNTERSQLALPPSLSLISPTAATGSSQTYVVNLDLGTVQRATVTYDADEPTGGPPGLLSFSSSGTTLAFASAATNLFYGDATTASEVYLTKEVPDEQQPHGEQVGTAPKEPTPSLEWKLNVTATAQRNGSVLLHARTPGAGRLSVEALAQMPASTSRGAGKAKGKKRSHATIIARDSASSHKRHSAGTPGPTLLTRTIATASTVTLSPATLQLSLRAGRAYAADLTGRGLYTVLHVTFIAAGHGTLSQTIPVTFHRHAVRKSTRARSGRKASSSKHGAGK